MNVDNADNDKYHSNRKKVIKVKLKLRSLKMAKDVHMKPTNISLDSTKMKKEGFSNNDTIHLNSKKFPIRTGIAAITLFTLGTILLWVSWKLGLDKEQRGLSFFILGLMCFIPGSYATTQLYGAYKGWKDYDYSQIPSYDD